MWYFLNILIILFAFISFLSLYYFTTRREKTMKKKRPQSDLEIASELNPKMEYENIETAIKDKFLDTNEGYSWLKKEFKNKYNKTFIRLFARDPRWIYCYWEINVSEYYQNTPVLRIFDESNFKHFDITINHNTDSWYINQIKQNNKYKVAIGYSLNNHFIALAYSNTIKTPADRPSEILDEKWMIIEGLDKYSYLLNINSSLSIIKKIEKRKRHEELNIDSFTLQKEKSRD